MLARQLRGAEREMRDADVRVDPVGSLWWRLCSRTHQPMLIPIMRLPHSKAMTSFVPRRPKHD